MQCVVVSVAVAVAVGIGIGAAVTIFKCIYTTHMVWWSRNWHFDGHFNTIIFCISLNLFFFFSYNILYFHFLIDYICVVRILLFLFLKKIVVWCGLLKPLALVYNAIQCHVAILCKQNRHIFHSIISMCN